MEFFQEGGWGMWMTLAFFLGFGVAAIARRDRDGDKLAYAGALATLASGLMGFSTGVYATVGHLDSIAAPEKAEILAVGIRESSNNTTLVGVLVPILVAVGVVLTARRTSAAAAPTTA